MINKYLKYMQEDYTVRNITFPFSEQKNIRDRLKKHLPVYTIRVDKEYNKYHYGDFVKTTWGAILEVIEVIKLKSIKNYIHYNELDQKTKKNLLKYNKLESIKLIYRKGSW